LTIMNGGERPSLKQGALQTPGNLAPRDATKGEVGQKLLTLELERRGWMSFEPDWAGADNPKNRAVVAGADPLRRLTA
jgi:hypothetical protein